MKTYLGDAVYVELDGYCVCLTTSNGIQDTNRIILEPAVLVQLMAWLDRIAEANKAEDEAQADVRRAQGSEDV